MAGKARVHELAKELGVTSKHVLERLKDQGEFVKSASSTVEAPVARRLRESFPKAAGSAAADEAEQRVSQLSRAYRVNLTVLALVALFTGAFLVFSVLALSVAQRASAFALLAVLGAIAGLYGELQSGSYVFMDRDYADNHGAPHAPAFEHALFVSQFVERRRVSRAYATDSHIVRWHLEIVPLEPNFR